MSFSFFNGVVTLIIAAAAFVSSFIVPARATKRTLEHQEKMFAMQFYAEHQVEAFTRYLIEASTIIYNDGGSRDAYQQSYGELLLYLPDDLRPLAASINDQILMGQAALAREEFNRLSSRLRPEIPRI